MRTSPLMVTAAVGLLTLLGGATANSQSGSLKSRVPFEFTVGTTTIPAGTYSVALSGADNNIVTIGNIHHTVAALTGARKSDRSNGPTRLVFHRYGHRYFLREMWFSSDRAETLPERNAERISALEYKRSAGFAPVVVSVAASVR
jgi:hypothetical protein